LKNNTKSAKICAVNLRNQRENKQQMEIRFETKEESNLRRQEEFLKLPKAERVLRFFALVAQVNQFPTKHKKDTSKNFTIVIPSKNR
jgi:hypothetical protein